MFDDLWNSQEIPGHVGLLHASGDFYIFENYQFKKSEQIIDKDSEPESVTIFDRYRLYNSCLEVVCGEGLSFGSNGFVILLDTKTNTPIWSLFSGETNPFNKIIDTGIYIVVISTSGTIFRFRVPTLEKPLREVFLSIP